MFGDKELCAFELLFGLLALFRARAELFRTLPDLKQSSMRAELVQYVEQRETDAKRAFLTPIALFMLLFPTYGAGVNFAGAAIGRMNQRNRVTALVSRNDLRPVLALVGDSFLLASFVLKFQEKLQKREKEQ